MSEIVYERENLLDSTHAGGEMINSGRFAFLLLLGADVMLYVGLVGGYFVLRGGSEIWPPPGSPKLTQTLMVWSLPIMLCGAIALWLSHRWHRQNLPARMRYGLTASLVMLSLFTALMALEWNSLLDQGMQMVTVFGGIFLTVTGAFLLHIVCCMFYMIRFLVRSSSWGRYSRSANSLPHLAMFLGLQTLMWFALYALIYT